MSHLLIWFYSFIPPGNKKWGFRLTRKYVDEWFGQLGGSGSDIGHCFCIHSSKLQPLLLSKLWFQFGVLGPFIDTCSKGTYEAWRDGFQRT